jgi:hypothetical protein
MALAYERTIPTELSPLVGEVSANFCGSRGVAWSGRWILTAAFSIFYTGITPCSLSIDLITTSNRLEPEHGNRGRCWATSGEDSRLRTLQCIL